MLDEALQEKILQILAPHYGLNLPYSAWEEIIQFAGENAAIQNLAYLEEIGCVKNLPRQDIGGSYTIGRNRLEITKRGLDFLSGIKPKTIDVTTRLAQEDMAELKESIKKGPGIKATIIGVIISLAAALVVSKFF
jgi:hypothetical protein